MATGGGPIESLTLNGRYFSVAQDNSPGRTLGGNKNSIEMNGDDTFRVVIEKTPSKIAGVAVQVDIDRR